MQYKCTRTPVLIYDTSLSTGDVNSTFDACLLCPLDTILLVRKGTPEIGVGVFSSSLKGDVLFAVRTLGIRRRK